MTSHVPSFKPTTEEEEALLAEYGVTNHFDDLLCFSAPSTSVFGYGGRDVFLTGTAPENEDHNAVSATNTAGDVCAVECTWPLECILLRHTGMLSHTTAEPLWEGINEVLGSAVKPASCATPCDVLSFTEASNEDIYSTPHINEHDGGDEELLNDLDGLLQEVDEVLARRRRYVDPMNEACLVERQRAAAEEERRWSPVSSDDKAPTDASALTETNTNLEEHDETKTENDGEKELESLFAYEFGPTAEERQIMRAWDEAVERCERQLGESLTGVDCRATRDAKPTDGVDVINEGFCLPVLRAEERESSVLVAQPSWMEQHPVIMESIATMEVRDSKLQAASCQKLEEARQERRRPRHVPPGQLVFERFLTRVDALLTPNEMEVQLRAVTAMETEENQSDLGTSVSEKQQVAKLEEKSGKPPTVVQIQKRAQRDCFRVRRETYEAWCMQEEEERTMRVLQWREEEVRRVENIIQECLSEGFKAHEMICAEEHTAYQSLCDLQRHQSLVIRQKEEDAQRAQVIFRLFHSTLKEHADIRRDIMDMEEDAVSELVREECCAREILFLQQQQRILGNVEHSKSTSQKENDTDQGRMTEETALQAIWTRRTEALKLFGAFCRATTSPPHVVAPFTGTTLRWKTLLREELLRTEWLNGSKRDIGNTANALAKLMADANDDDDDGAGGRPSHLCGSRQGMTAAAPSLPSDDLSASLVGSSVRLDASLAKQLQPRIFGVAKSDTRELVQLCHSVSFALEQIDSVDFSSLATLEVRTKDAGSFWGKCTIPATPLVRELDLGSNSLTKLPLDDILRVFPSIRGLNLSDNKLKNLTCRVASTRGVTEAHAHSLAQATRLAHLNVSMNELQNIEAIGRLLSYHLRRLVIYANHIDSLRPLIPCSQLESLEASRNKVDSLSELQHLSLLQTVDLSENLITTWDPLAHHVLLQNLYLSRNQIRILPKTLFLGFLRQLFLNGNCLEVLPDDCFCWIPLLTVLHVENNKLRNVSGLAHCPRLTDVSLAFNQLQRVEDLSPLTACRRLQTLSISENPFALGDGDENKGTSSRRVRNTILAWFPQLCELNHEQVTDVQRRSAMEDEMARFWLFCVNRDLLRQRQENTVHNAWCWPRFSAAKDVQQLCGMMEFRTRYMHPNDAYADMFAALTSDVSLATMQKEQDILAAICRRRYNDALYVEEALQKRIRDPKQRLNPVVHCLSDKIEKWNQRERIFMLQRHLTSLQTVPRVRANVHVRPVLFHERAQAHKEARAKVVISEWVYLRLLGRRARKELEARKAACAEARRKRYEAAARIIQPVWRGAALRSRLKRILHPTGENEEDGEVFAHVSLDFMDGSETAGDGEDVKTLLQQVLEAHGGPPNFFVAPFAARTLGANLVSESFTPPRANSAATHGVSRIDAHNTHRPGSQPVWLSQQEQQPPSLSPVSEGDGWSALVNSRLRKRQKKMERAQRENMRREFMQDPLKVKRAMGEL